MQTKNKEQQNKLNKLMVKIKKRYPHFYNDAGSHYIRNVIKEVVMVSQKNP